MRQPDGFQKLPVFNFSWKFSKFSWDWRSDNKLKWLVTLFCIVVFRIEYGIVFGRNIASLFLCLQSLVEIKLIAFVVLNVFFSNA
jgi:MFS superfamily sulfate permease-like transporter